MNIRIQTTYRNRYRYYRECIVAANEYVTRADNKELLQFIRKHGKVHAGLTGTTDYAYSGLLYKLFMFRPFSDILDTDMSVGVVDIRPTRNLALLTQIIGKFEYLHRVDVFNGSYIDRNTELLFNLYLKLLYDGGISEYEDEAEYAPSGCVSFLTIHQSKGMEFPIVLVDSLSNVPRKTYKDLMTEVEEKYFHRPAFEPYDQTKYFDFWRLYYTAFSRAQNLLVLTCDENKRTPSQYFRDIYDEIQSVNSDEFDLSEFSFQSVKKVNLKNSFSFTSHITVYETCALQYKFYKELEFMPVRQNAMMFGTLVHETIEDIHRAAIRGEVDKITNDNIATWFESNYNSLVKSEHTYLAEPQRNAALSQVERYAERMDGKWASVQQAEVDVSLVKEDYIIDGKIDLVKGVDGTVEIVDFKSERKPDMVKMRERLEHYRRQLQIYAYLIEQRTGQKVSKMHMWRIPMLQPADKVEPVGYPTQKPEKLIERIIRASSNIGDIVFDCFMGSGTTQAVAMKLGRKFIGADINLGAVQVTTKRLLQLQDKLAEPMQEIIKPDVIDLESGKEEQQIMNAEKYTGFEVYNVNNYDFFRNPIEARDLIIQALEIQPFPQSDVWDGELDGRMVKIMPVNRIATKADLEELKANLPYKTYEKRKAENPMQPVEKITIVCMGHEPDLKASLEQELSEYKLNIEIVDILRDKKDLSINSLIKTYISKASNCGSRRNASLFSLLSLYARNFLVKSLYLERILPLFWL